MVIDIWIFRALCTYVHVLCVIYAFNLLFYLCKYIILLLAFYKYVVQEAKYMMIRDVNTLVTSSSYLQ